MCMVSLLVLPRRPDPESLSPALGCVHGEAPEKSRRVPEGRGGGFPTRLPAARGLTWVRPSGVQLARVGDAELASCPRGEADLLDADSTCGKGRGSDSKSVAWRRFSMFVSVDLDRQSGTRGEDVDLH